MGFGLLTTACRFETLSFYDILKVSSSPPLVTIIDENSLKSKLL